MKMIIKIVKLQCIGKIVVAQSLDIQIRFRVISAIFRAQLINGVDLKHFLSLDKIMFINNPN
jgi:hypothetical protein